jgi:hypothetical protein
MASSVTSLVCVSAAGEGLEPSLSIPANGGNPLSPFGAGPRHMTHTIYGRAFIPFGSVAVHSVHFDWFRSLSTWVLGLRTLLGIESYRA